MKGCLGCLGLLVGLSLLAWPIEQLQRVFGWSNTQAGYVLLAVVALLAVGASRERGAMAVSHGATREARSAPFRGRYRIVQAQDSAAPRHERPGDRPMRGRGELSGRAVDAPAGGRGTPLRQGVARTRDPLPAQLRFRILQRDGFRCRYCGRPGNAPGVVLHVDHVVPVAAGGTTREDNLLAACEECNLGKGSRAAFGLELESLGTARR